MLAFTRLELGDERRTDRLRRCDGSELVGKHCANEPWPLGIGAGLHGSKAGERLDYGVVYALVSPRSELAEAADRDVDDAGRGCADIVLGDTEPFNDAGTKILHQYIRACGE